MPKTTKEIVMSACNNCNNPISIPNQLPSEQKWYSEEEVKKLIKKEHNKVLDDNHILHGKDAKNFIETMERHNRGEYTEKEKKQNEEMKKLIGKIK